MSTLNVANISDDQSTLSNSANSSDVLNNTTTVDTKFVTNGCAKAYVSANSSAVIYSSMNISSSTYDGLGTETFLFASDLSNNSYSLACSVGRATDVNITQTAKLTTGFTVKIWDGSNSAAINGSPNVVAFGDLA
jgi:hypothetical protein